MNADKTRAWTIDIFKVKSNILHFKEWFCILSNHIILYFRSRRSRYKIPVTLRTRNFTYFRIVRSFNKCEFENGSSGKHKRSRTDVVQSNICCYQDIEDCQYQDKRYCMDLDATSRVVFSWRFFCSALYDFLHFRDALTPTMPLRGMTALYHAKITAVQLIQEYIQEFYVPAERIFIRLLIFICISMYLETLLQKYTL